MCFVSRKSGGTTNSPQSEHHWPPLWAMVFVALHFGHRSESGGWLSDELEFMVRERTKDEHHAQGAVVSSGGCRLGNKATVYSAGLAAGV